MSRDGPDIALPVPLELIEAIAERAAEIVAGQDRGPEPWIDVEQAAEHLACPTSRIHALTSAGRIPHQRDGSRLLFRRSALDVSRTGGRSTHEDRNSLALLDDHEFWPSL